MDAFSYLSVLLSIILGLAITQVLQGYRTLILARGQVRLAATPLIWSGVVLVVAVQSWWASFGLRDHENWAFGTFAVIILQMIMQFLSAAVVLPEAPNADGTIDLAEHHEQHRRAFFGFILAAIATSIAKDLVLDGHLPETRNLLSQVLGAVIALVALLVANPRVQLLLAIFAAAGVATYIVQLFAQL